MRVQGIALVQVLILTALITIFALFISSSAREQIQVASWSNDRAKADLLIKSTYAELVFSLLSYERARLAVTDGGTILTEKWNFFGHPFFLGKSVEVRVQDLAGKISLHFFERTRMERLLRQGRVSEDRIGLIIDHLLDWQDTDNIARPQGFEGTNRLSVRDGFVTDFTDFEHMVNLKPEEKSLLSKNTTIYFNGSFNPLTASKTLLAAETDETSAEQLDLIRKQRDIAPSEYRRITGKGSDTDIRLYPSASLEIIITANVGEARISKTFVVGLKRNSKGKIEPVNVLYEKG
ncbi:hypothetical protein PSECIP111951_00676 [Pseudoalteromonas holothuriae]|uniref:Type II secretion system protein K n=1 Tax=Pseudoalteromonas holothuriae TaxID=2963714 RepID=A0ABM9GFE5_9GAMM|nr:type II secretion system protein GspK [Pseudoalteromonas sp. CIP111951]CAH9052721.1 hypothetical protein PSECIP111951_00676 [Pseudoalteromonas sp. CIP111951]